MALIACEECGQPISQSASTCPHCGARTRHSRQFISGVVGMLLGVIVVYVLVLTVGQLSNGGSQRLGQSMASSVPTQPAKAP